MSLLTRENNEMRNNSSTSSTFFGRMRKMVGSLLNVFNFSTFQDVNNEQDSSDETEENFPPYNITPNYRSPILRDKIGFVISKYPTQFHLNYQDIHLPENFSFLELTSPTEANKAIDKISLDYKIKKGKRAKIVEKCQAKIAINEENLLILNRNTVLKRKEPFITQIDTNFTINEYLKKLRDYSDNKRYSHSKKIKRKYRELESSDSEYERETDYLKRRIKVLNESLEDYKIKYEDVVKSRANLSYVNILKENQITCLKEEKIQLEKLKNKEREGDREKISNFEKNEVEKKKVIKKLEEDLEKEKEKNQMLNMQQISMVHQNERMKLIQETSKLKDEEIERLKKDLIEKNKKIKEVEEELEKEKSQSSFISEKLEKEEEEKLSVFQRMRNEMKRRGKLNIIEEEKFDNNDSDAKSQSEKKSNDIIHISPKEKENEIEEKIKEEENLKESNFSFVNNKISVVIPKSVDQPAKEETKIKNLIIKRKVEDNDNKKNLEKPKEEGEKKEEKEEKRKIETIESNKKNVYISKNLESLDNHQNQPPISQQFPEHNINNIPQINYSFSNIQNTNEQQTFRYTQNNDHIYHQISNFSSNNQTPEMNFASKDGNLLNNNNPFFQLASENNSSNGNASKPINTIPQVFHLPPSNNYNIPNTNENPSQNPFLNPPIINTNPNPFFVNNQTNNQMYFPTNQANNPFFNTSDMNNNSQQQNFNPLASSIITSTISSTGVPIYNPLVSLQDKTNSSINTSIVQNNLQQDVNMETDINSNNINSISNNTQKIINPFLALDNKRIPNPLTNINNSNSNQLTNTNNSNTNLINANNSQKIINPFLALDNKRIPNPLTNTNNSNSSFINANNKPNDNTIINPFLNCRSDIFKADSNIDKPFTLPSFSDGDLKDNPFMPRIKTKEKSLFDTSDDYNRKKRFSNRDLGLY